jgi:hypothetical protein
MYRNISDKTASLLGALYRACEDDPDYKRKVSSIISMLEDGTMYVPETSFTNGNFWELSYRNETRHYTFMMQTGDLFNALVLA